MRKVKKVSEIGINKNHKVLVVMPHPDDEAFSVGGLMYKMRKERIEVRVLTLTKGEKSTLRFGIPENVDLAEVRPGELKQALKVLGVEDHFIAGIGDGEIEANYSKTKEVIANEIIQYNADFVFTFEPWGIYGHPDHVAVSKAVTEIHGDFNNSFTLIYTTVGKWFRPTASALKMAKDPTKVKPIEPNLVVGLSIDEVVKKIKSIRKHKSQFKFDMKTMSRFVMRRMLINEFFYKNK